MDQQVPETDLLLEMTVRHPGIDPDVLAKLISTFLESLREIGYIILPKTLQSEGGDINLFEDTVSRWCAKEIDPTDVNGAQVIQALVSEGWVILPPR